MKQNNKVIFLRQDIFKLSTFAFIILSLVSGGSIIFSREMLGGPFKIDNIYAMYATISELLLMFVATNLFGKEFHYKTVNMLRVSKRSCMEIIAQKLLVMEILAIVVAACACIEVGLYAFIFKHDINALHIAANVLIAYSVYALFLFALATTIVMMLKNIFSSFVTVIAIVSFSPLLMNILSRISAIQKLIDCIPFSFMRSAFSFARFNLNQIIIMLVWSSILLVISHKLFKCRGYV